MKKLDGCCRMAEEAAALGCCSRLFQLLKTLRIQRKMQKLARARSRQELQEGQEVAFYGTRNLRYASDGNMEEFGAVGNFSLLEFSIVGLNWPYHIERLVQVCYGCLVIVEKLVGSLLKRVYVKSRLFNMDLGTSRSAWAIGYG
ncbi:hypothetical protein HispidOSU_022783 [Sigmodon hispidus]